MEHAKDKNIKKINFKGLIAVLMLAILLPVAAILSGCTTKNYEVQFLVANSPVKVVEVEENGLVTPPTDSEIADYLVGYTLEGWYNDPLYLDRFDFAAGITRDTKIYGRLIADKIDLTIFVDDKVSVEVSGLYNETRNLNNAVNQHSAYLTKSENYNLLGFKKGTEGEVFDKNTLVKLTTNDIYYAVWQGKTQYIEFDTENAFQNEESFYMDYTTARYGDYYIIPNLSGVYDANGFSYIGMRLDGIVYPVGSKILITNYTLLEIAFGEDRHYVAIIEHPNKEVNYAYGEDNSVELPTPTDIIDGQYYVFLGYYTENIDWSVAVQHTLFEIGYEVEAVEGGITYYGIWEPKTIEIVYDKNNENASGSMATQSSRFGSVVTLNQNNYVLANHTFGGWSLTPGGDFDLTNASNITIDSTLLENAILSDDKYILTLHAVFNRIQITIAFDYNGGTGDINSIQYGKGTDVSLPNVEDTKAMLEYYTLTGWSTEQNGGTTYNLDTTYPVSEPTTLYAVWTRNKVTITFNQGDGTSDGTYTTVEVDAGSDYTLPTGGFESTTEDFILMGFSPDPELGEEEMTFYKAGETIFIEDIKNIVVLTAIYGEGLPQKGGALASYSWTEIAQISEAGLAEEYFNIGDEKDITLSDGEVLTMQIWGFDHDNLTDGYGAKAGITFGMKNLMASSKRMNTTRTNIGSWEVSEMRTETLPSVFLTLPEELKGVIKAVDKKTIAGNFDTTIATSFDQLFLFSWTEVIAQTANGYKDEGVQYAYWVGHVQADRTKYLSNGAGDVSNWWFRSPSDSNASAFRYLTHMYGSVGMTPASNSYGVCFGFCV